MMHFAHRNTIASAIISISQTGDEGLRILSTIRDFLGLQGIKAYIHTQKRRVPYRVMHHLKICARPSVTAFLEAMLSRSSVKHVAVQDILRFFKLYPSTKSLVTIERNKARGKYGAVNLDPVQLRADLNAGLTKTALAKKYDVSSYTITKYLDPDYRTRYDAYRRGWRAKRRAVAIAAIAARGV